MLISARDGLKFISVSVVLFCAVFVCTFFLNYYLDVLPLVNTVSEEYAPLMSAQLAQAKFTCGLAGGVLGAIAVLVTAFYIKTYIKRNNKKVATFKAMGYSATKIAASFTVFGLSVLFGCASGFAIAWAAMPAIYKQLTISGLTVKINFHIILPVMLVAAPTAVFTLLIFAFAAAELNKPVMRILKGGESKKFKPTREYKSFAANMVGGTLRSKKLLAFFVAFSGFCFSAMVQMGLSMRDYSTSQMGMLILSIGLILALTSAVMALTALVEGNAKNLAVLKAIGYSPAQRFALIFAAFIPFAFIGFAVGSVYQHILLKIMIEIVFSEVAQMPAYKFDFNYFFITVAAFLISYAALLSVYFYKTNKVSVKQIMTE